MLNFYVIRGYAGISAIIYFISLIIFYASLGITEHDESIAATILLTFLFIPAYLIYLKVWVPKLKKMFRKGKLLLPKRNLRTELNLNNFFFTLQYPMKKILNSLISKFNN